MLSTEAFAKMKTGVRVVNCARGELIDEAALLEAMNSGKVAGAALDVFEKEPPTGHPLLEAESLVATPHIGGSTEEAQEIVGVRIAEQISDYLKSGIALNAVNMPALTQEQYRVLGPYISLAERLGTFAAHISKGNPKAVHVTYFGKIAEQNTHMVRNAGIAGVLSRSLSQRANAINAMQFAADRGLTVAETHDHRSGHIDTVRLELETNLGTTTVEGAVVLDKARLIQVDGIYCEAPLEGHITFLKNQDVPGVIGYVGSVFGKSGVNIATFSLGRKQAASEAISIIVTDERVPETLLNELLENKALTQARSVEFS